MIFICWIISVDVIVFFLRNNNINNILFPSIATVLTNSSNFFIFNFVDFYVTGNTFFSIHVLNRTVHIKENRSYWTGQISLNRNVLVKMNSSHWTEQFILNRTVLLSRTVYIEQNSSLYTEQISLNRTVHNNQNKSH